MEDPRAADQTTAICTVVIFCLCLSLVLWVTAYRGLYADGSNLLLNAIELRNFYHVSETRITSTFMTQLPVVLAIWLHLRSLALLSMIYTAALAAIPVACYSLSIWISRRETYLFAATNFVIVCCFYPTSLLLVGEGAIYLSLFWLAFTVLLSESTHGKPVYDLLLLLISIAALEVYETSALFSAVLAILTGRRANRAISPLGRFVLLSGTILFVFGSLFGLAGILLPRSHENESGFMDGVRRFGGNQVYLCLLAIAVVSSLTAFVRRRAVRFVLLGALFLAIVLFVDWRLRPGPYPALGYPMYQRAQVYCVLAVIVSVVLIGNVFSSRFKRLTYFQAGALVPALIAVLAIDTVDTVRWTGFIGSFCREMTVSGSVSHAFFFAEGPTRRYGIDWTFPTMSVVLGGQASRAILAKPGFAAWQPFDPRHPPDIRPFKVGETICP